MTYQTLTLKKEYRSPKDDVVQDFFNPVLSCSKIYKRSVGFFSSTALVEITKGIAELVKNGGKIQIVASPKLSDEDIEAIKLGYEKKSEVIEKILLGELKEAENIFENKRLNLLANLIANGTLELKIAFTDTGNSIGIYHEKLGVFEDFEGNRIAFDGSMNESKTAMRYNYESVNVYCDWNPEDKERFDNKTKAFENIWNNTEKDLRVVDFPNVTQKILDKYKKADLQPSDYEIDKVEFEKTKENTFNISESDVKYDVGDKKKVTNEPKMPSWLSLHDYQQEAITNWHKSNYHGIFDMATGTGKTLTGLSALVDLYTSEKQKLFSIIVCPYQHLVEQWVDDIKEFNIQPIIGFSSSPQKDWKERLRNSIIDIQLPKLNKNFFCFVCTNATFSSQYVQTLIDKIRTPKLLLVDEAHNFGAPYLSKLLKDSYKYRLALSATISRHGDEEGTQALFDFFGEKCIEYDIERAIKEKFLTPYKYYPVIVTLSDDELIQYKQFSKELSNYLIKDKKGKMKLSKAGQIIAMQRARIVAGAASKITKLKEVINPYENAAQILVYCGATTMIQENNDISDSDETGKRQITVVSELLGNELNMKCHHFTSNESIQERKEITKRFTNGELQALVAIKCLDEGVNIPSIKTAFILASTTNPKEYIQRRGRVLLLSKGEEFAEIYDFITLPYELNDISSRTEGEIKEVLSLVKKELVRAKEFSRIALNNFESEIVLDSIQDSYGISSLNIKEEDVFNDE